MSEWFVEGEIQHKREDLAKIIQDIAKEKEATKEVVFPELKFASRRNKRKIKVTVESIVEKQLEEDAAGSKEAQEVNGQEQEVKKKRSRKPSPDGKKLRPKDKSPERSLGASKEKELMAKARLIVQNQCPAAVQGEDPAVVSKRLLEESGIYAHRENKEENNKEKAGEGSTPKNGEILEEKVCALFESPEKRPKGRSKKSKAAPLNVEVVKSKRLAREEKNAQSSSDSPPADLSDELKELDDDDDFVPDRRQRLDSSSNSQPSPKGHQSKRRRRRLSQEEEDVKEAARKEEEEIDDDDDAPLVRSKRQKRAPPPPSISESVSPLPKSTRPRREVVERVLTIDDDDDDDFEDEEEDRKSKKKRRKRRSSESRSPSPKKAKKKEKRKKKKKAKAKKVPDEVTLSSDTEVEEASEEEDGDSKLDSSSASTPSFRRDKRGGGKREEKYIPEMIEEDDDDDSGFVIPRINQQQPRQSPRQHQSAKKSVYDRLGRQNEQEDSFDKTNELLQPDKELSALTRPNGVENKTKSSSSIAGKDEKQVPPPQPPAAKGPKKKIKLRRNNLPDVVAQPRPELAVRESQRQAETRAAKAGHDEDELLGQL